MSFCHRSNSRLVDFLKTFWFLLKMIRLKQTIYRTSTKDGSLLHMGNESKYHVFTSCLYLTSGIEILNIIYRILIPFFSCPHNFLHKNWSWLNFIVWSNTTTQWDESWTKMKIIIKTNETRTNNSWWGIIL